MQPFFMPTSGEALLEGLMTGIARATEANAKASRQPDFLSRINRQRLMYLNSGMVAECESYAATALLWIKTEGVLFSTGQEFSRPIPLHLTQPVGLYMARLALRDGTWREQTAQLAVLPSRSAVPSVKPSEILAGLSRLSNAFRRKCIARGTGPNGIDVCLVQLGWTDAGMPTATVLRPIMKLPRELETSFCNWSSYHFAFPPVVPVRAAAILAAHLPRGIEAQINGALTRTWVQKDPADLIGIGVGAWGQCAVDVFNRIAPPVEHTTSTQKPEESTL